MFRKSFLGLHELSNRSSKLEQTNPVDLKLNLISINVGCTKLKYQNELAHQNFN
jgi:hypothetical protein